MILKDELMRYAILGTENSTLHHNLLEALQQQGIASEDKSQEQILLEAHAMQYLLTRAADKHTLSQELSLPPSVDVSAERFINAASAGHMEYAIRQAGSRDQLIKEFIQLVIDTDRVITPAHLPLLMNFAKDKPDFKESIRRVYGLSGKWICDNYDEWAAFRPCLFDEPTTLRRWEFGNNKERYDALKTLRQHQPRKALSLLEMVFGRERSNERALFITALQINLSSADEAFLEKSLDDKGQQVRHTAAVLLSHINESALAERFRVRAKACLRFGTRLLGGAKLDVLFPESCTPDMQRDGIHPKLKLPGYDDSEVLFYQIISQVEPSFWATQYATSAENFMKAVQKSDYNALLLLALGNAAQLHDNTEWIEHICKAFISLDLYDKYPSCASFFEELPNATFNALMYDLLSKPKTTLSDMVYQLLQTDGQKWDKALSEAILARIKPLIGNNSRIDHWQVQALLKHAAFVMPVELYDMNMLHAESVGTVGKLWQLDTDEFLSIMRFRNDMYRTIYQS